MYTDLIMLSFSFYVADFSFLFIYPNLLNDDYDYLVVLVKCEFMLKYYLLC